MNKILDENPDGMIFIDYLHNSETHEHLIGDSNVKKNIFLAISKT